MRLKLTIILAVLNVAAFFWIYQLEKQADPKEAYLRDTVNVLPNASGVDEIKIEVNTAQRKEERVIKRTRTGWEIVSPFVWPANENALQRILTQLQFLEKEVSIPLDEIRRSGQTLADFGLENPSIILTYMVGDEPTVLKLGSPTQLGNRVYLLPPDGESVLVVSDELLKAITIGLADLRSGRVFDIPLFEVRSLAIEEGDQRYRFEETGEDWWLESPIRARANNAMVDAALGDLTALRAVNIVRALPEGGESAVFGQPYMRITLGGNNRRSMLLVGATVADSTAGETAQRYARLENSAASGTYFTVEQAPLERLRNPDERLRERRFLNFDPADVNAIEITEDGKTLTLQKLEKREADAPESWQLFRTNDGGDIKTLPADTTIVDTLLTSLRNLEARQFVSDAPSGEDLAKWGLAKPHSTLVLKGDVEKTLLFGLDVNDGKLYAKLASEPFVYEVSSLILVQVSSDPLTYRSRVLDQSMAGAQLIGLSITDLQDDKVVFSGKIDRDKETWSILWKDLPEAEKQAALDLVDQLQDFRVNQYLYTRFAPLPDKPWRYKLVADFFLPGGTDGTTVQREYDFTIRMQADRQIGGSPANNLTFTLTQPMIDALFELTFVQDTPQLPQTPEGLEQAAPLPIPGGDNAQPQPAPEAAPQTSTATDQQPATTP